MAQTHAQKMVAKLGTMLLDNAGLTSVNVDGQAVSYADLEKKYAHWERKVLREQGKAPRISRIRLDRF